MMNNNGTYNSVVAGAVLPDGSGGFTACPDLLTEEEAIRYLRLDVGGPKNPANTLRYYRERGKLKGTRVGNRIRYTKRALDQFLEAVTEN